MRSGERDDFVERQVEQLGAVVAALLARLGAGGGAASAAQVIREAKAAQGALLGPLAQSLPLVDAASAAQLLRDPRAAKLYADLLRVEAAARRLAGEADAALALEARAAGIDPA